MSVKVFRQIKKLYTFEGIAKKDGRRVQSEDFTMIPNGAMIVSEGVVRWTGSEKKLKGALKDFIATLANKNSKKSAKNKIEDHSLNLQSVFPGFVEPHTHLVFAGDRRHEFEMRNQGATYTQIAAQGGGILSTVQATRKASGKELLRLAQLRADRFHSQGVTTLEAKSGYGLDEETELKILSVNRKVQGPRIVSTYLGPHAVPAGRSRAEYVKEVCESTLPQIARKKLADRADIYIEKGFFDLSDAQAYFKIVKNLNLSVCAHVDQLNALGSSVQMLPYAPDSLEHCVHLSEDQIQKLAKSSTTLVLLPTSDFYLKMAYPKARTLVDAGARIALATDFNPGTSPTQDLSFVGVLARLEMRLTLPEVFAAYTYNAACALGFNRLGKLQLGALVSGAEADFVGSSGELEDFFYQVGSHPASRVFQAGNLKKP